MSFESILQGIVSECKGVLGIALMESDGIAIASSPGNAALPGGALPDVGSAGVEFGRIMTDIAKASDALGGGSAEETVVTLARFVLIFHQIEDGIMLVMALARDGNLGKARYLIRRNLVALRQEL